MNSGELCGAGDLFLNQIIDGFLSAPRFFYQFFICVGDSAFLDGKYTVFGEVVSGMDVADKIVSQPRDSRDNPDERVEMKIKIIEK